MARQTTLTDYLNTRAAGWVSPRGGFERESDAEQYRKLRATGEQFDPNPEELSYSRQVTPYPARRQAEGCATVRITVEKDYEGNVTAYAYRNTDGKRLGKVATKQIGAKTLAVKWSSLLRGGESLYPGFTPPEEDFTRCGIGPRLYEAIAQYACAKKMRMASDTTLLAPSKAFWEKQARKGLAVKRGGRYYLRSACGAVRAGLNGVKPKKRRKG